MRVYPRLDDADALEVIAALAELSPKAAVDVAANHHPAQSFPPLGGTPVAGDELDELRERLLTTAQAFGYPDRSLKITAGFDRECARELHEQMDITPHEASIREMWTFLTCVLLPDIAIWRFPARTEDRLLGHVNRNAFRRLWWRVEVLGDPPPRDRADPLWDLEDALVQVMERPGISGNPAVARTLAHVYREATENVSSNERQELMRDLQRRLMRRSAFMSLDLLRQNELEGLLRSLMDETLAAIRPATATAPALVRPASSKAAEPAADGISIERIPLDELRELILETIADHEPITDGQLVSFVAQRGFTVPRGRERLVKSFAWYLAGRKQVDRRADGAWVMGDTRTALPPICTESIEELAERARALSDIAEEDDLVERIFVLAAPDVARVPKPYLRAARAAVRLARAN